MTNANVTNSNSGNEQDDLNHQDPETESDTSSGGTPEEPDVSNPQKTNGS
jgi:hypothetical protein